MGGKEDLIFRDCKSCQNRNVLAWTRQVPVAGHIAPGLCASRCPDEKMSQEVRS